MVMDAGRERLAVLRQHQSDLAGYPGTILHGPVQAGERRAVWAESR
jgi:hypothetical protein